MVFICFTCTQNFFFIQNMATITSDLIIIVTSTIVGHCCNPESLRTDLEAKIYDERKSVRKVHMINETPFSDV